MADLAVADGTDWYEERITLWRANLIRVNKRKPKAYLDRFFDTAAERQQPI
jgi:hypothetical protein